MEKTGESGDKSFMNESTGDSRPKRDCVGKGMDRLGDPVDHSKKKEKVKTPTTTSSGGVFFPPEDGNKAASSTETLVGGGVQVANSSQSGASIVSTSSSIRRRLEAERDARKKMIELERQDRELRTKARLQEEQLKLAEQRANIQDEKELLELDLEIQKQLLEEEDSDEDRSKGKVRGLSAEEEDSLVKFEKECREKLPPQQQKLMEEEDRKIALALQKKEEEEAAQRALANQFDNDSSNSSSAEDSSSDDDGGDVDPPVILNKRNGGRKMNKEKTNNDQLVFFANTIANAIANAGGGGGGTNQDKFLARQVQGKDLPHFTGKPEEWPMFISSFNSSTKSCVYTDADNLARLQKCLRSEALKAVQPLLVEPSNVSNIIKNLKERFGNPDRIIKSLIIKLKETPPVKEFKLETVVDMGIAIDNLVATITALKCPQHLSNPQLLEDLLNKFPPSFQMRWASWMQKKKLENSLTSFAKWMEKETSSAIQLIPIKSTTEEKKPSHPQGQGRRPQNVLAAGNAPVPANRQRKCRCCSSLDHRHQQCKKLEEMTEAGRHEWIKANKLCFGCCNFGHKYKDCKTKKPCTINGCGRLHHPLLHRQADAPLQRQEGEPHVIAMTDHWEDKILRIGQGDGQALLNIIPITLTGPRGKIETYAIFDPGSAHTLLQKQVAQQLGIVGVKSPFSFCWINNQIVAEPDSQLLEVEITGPNKKKFMMTHIRTVEELKFSKKSVKASLIKKYKHLSNLDIKTFDDGVPTILIGQPHAFLIIPTRRIAGPPNAPVAAETKLGWVLNGVEPYTLDTEIVQSVNFTEMKDEDLHQLVKYHFTTEQFGVDVKNVNPQSKEDSQAQTYFLTNLKKQNGRFQTKLLWKDDTIQLPESKLNAIRRLYSIERKMDRDPDFATKYANNINEYIDLGYLKKLSEEDKKYVGPRIWYLPHFAVSKASKPDKIRLVFDAAARTNGTSLNENLLRGPDQLNPLPAVLFKFREKKIAFTADIKHMFHRVAIEEEDQHSQRMLWRGMDRKISPEEYAMMVMTFGSTCSPYCAQAVKNKNAKDHEEEYPDAADAIIRKHYVDDYLDSCDTVEEGVTRFKEVFKIHKNGNFHICNWITNNEEMSSQIPEALRSSSQKLLGVEKENLWTDRVLGMMWNSESDQFRFVTSFHRVPKEVVNGERVPTKREALSLIMSLFDPLGFAACLTVKAKILLQDAWREKIDWDTELPAAIHKKWHNLLNEIKLVEEFTIPRCYSEFFSSSPEVQLHIFCDASTVAFAAVAYFRVQAEDGFHTSLVCAKTRVAPLKPITVPRLELQGAVMGSRLAKTISQHHDGKIHKIHYWTDSKNVLDWIHSDARKFNQFVAHRIGEIHEKTEITEWHWISTHENVADEATRDSQPCDFQPTSRWLNGPSFLKYPEDQWPINAILEDEITPETREEKEHVGIITEDFPIAPIKIDRFSNWSRLVRATAQAKKFIQLASKRTTTPTITPDDVKIAEKLWWKWSQQDSYKNELDMIQNNQQVKKGTLSNLSLIMDEDGILRLLGRLPFCPPAANLQINPVVLSSNHPYTMLMLEYLHKKYGHHGQEQVVNEIRQNFYIPELRAAVRKTWTNCQVCKNHRVQPKPPQMGMVPPARIGSFLRPFTHTGVDYFGPYEATVKRSKEKRYGALFTCLTTRAIHLEIAHSLSTDSFLMALRRFIARRGNPQEIWSDNGTNFVGANNELKACLQELDQDAIMNETASRSIKWNFIPPLSPHMGGSWERMVRAVKIALSSTMQERHPKDEVLSTLFAEAEMIVNGHPLTYIAMGPDSPEALTPNHFLLGTSSANQPHGAFNDSDLIPGKQWRVAQRLADFFWKRWIKEFLPILTRRTKWNKKEDPIKIGDVVIIVDGNLPRNSWPKGIVTKTYENNGQVRVAEIKTAGGTYRRPVHKLCVLDVQPNLNLDNQTPQELTPSPLMMNKFMGGSMLTGST